MDLLPHQPRHPAFITRSAAGKIQADFSHGRADSGIDPRASRPITGTVQDPAGIDAVEATEYKIAIFNLAETKTGFQIAVNGSNFEVRVQAAHFASRR